MKYYRYILPLLFCLTIIKVYGQEVSGKVVEIIDNKKVGLPGVNIYWQGTTQGGISDNEGNFSLTKEEGQNNLIFSYIGYSNDTITDFSKPIYVVLNSNVSLDEVVVSSRANGSVVSRLDPIFTQKITADGLTRAACCNLSESFENNASVDVSYSDATTGAKRISLLGLSGIYSPILAENMPNIRGLASVWGLGYVPGSWMESISVSKGTSSVVNGFESMTGQINFEYKKPSDEKLHLNGYVNSMGKYEANVNAGFSLTPKVSSAIFAHYENLSVENDHNNDGFLDEPLTEQFNVFNRWMYDGDKLKAQWGVKAIKETRDGGQKSSLGDDRYKINIETDRYEVFTKTGYIFSSDNNQSIGLQNQYTYHRQQSVFGNNIYNAKQISYYGNLIFQTDVLNSDILKVGGSFMFDQYTEHLNDTSMYRSEKVPGIFAEYTMTIADKVNIIGGIRADFHNVYGTFYTPRLHVRYMINENNILRASVGKGYRSPNVIAENSYLLASNAEFKFIDTPKQEKAWNFGLNFTKYIDIAGRQLTLNLDAYRTEFENQIIIDRDSDVSSIYIYNLNGQSYSNSFQIEGNIELFRNFDLTMAYRYNDVKMTINNKLKTAPLYNRFKGLVTGSWASRLKRWQIDLTAQLNGDSRLPDKYSRNGIDQHSPVYTIINSQVTRNFKNWAVYLGSENMTNYKQDNPIYSANDPFDKSFDASTIWGPISGIKVYAGFKYTIK
ncbi:MAG: TonB-dependent receptor domain-containing protein [Hyphomicrobiales bacterium]